MTTGFGLRVGHRKVMKYILLILGDFGALGALAKQSEGLMEEKDMEEVEKKQDEGEAKARVDKVKAREDADQEAEKAKAEEKKVKAKQVKEEAKPMVVKLSRTYKDRRNCVSSWRGTTGTKAATSPAAEGQEVTVKKKGIFEKMKDPSNGLYECFSDARPEGYFVVITHARIELVWKAYRSLDREYRKNLKRLYIVHSSFFSKMLFFLAGAITSPKSFRKLAYIDTLSELAYHVPLTQIVIPPAVYQGNLKHESRITLPDIHSSTSSSAAFGVPLEDVVGYQGEKSSFPASSETVSNSFEIQVSMKAYFAVYRLLNFYALLKKPTTEALFLLKYGKLLPAKYLKDLPNPIFGEESYALVRRCPAPTRDPGDVEAVRYVREVILPELPPCVYVSLSHILQVSRVTLIKYQLGRIYLRGELEGFGAPYPRPFFAATEEGSWVNEGRPMSSASNGKIASLSAPTVPREDVDDGVIIRPLSQDDDPVDEEERREDKVMEKKVKVKKAGYRRASSVGVAGGLMVPAYK
ncbi:hypothetical protein K435DRAFT_802287 [Dendrothele bispora CBS 962.96]|uniref:CRAL-TRIO domain-containing protein n=1 Tax=Dendrothele bispora (strain CBS 962.96) TaxID=1314807 RepID=A0A4S8LM58_DENBC|nr:hypothetical protein K435DRAFT_802287 [Dendrothele bispora CBS 962.96]